MEEICWFIYGIRTRNGFLGYTRFYSRGSVAAVGFKWEDAMSLFLLGWMHSHPDSFGTDPSETDNKTMRSWVRGLNKPMICAIKCQEQVSWYDYRRGPLGDILREDFTVSHFSGFYKGTIVE